MHVAFRGGRADAQPANHIASALISGREGGGRERVGGPLEGCGAWSGTYSTLTLTALWNGIINQLAKPAGQPYTDRWDGHL